MVCPDDAGTGLAPHSAAKDFSDFIRPGLSPAATSSAAAVSGPTPVAAKGAGLASAQRRRISIVEFCDFCVEGLVSAGEVA